MLDILTDVSGSVSVVASAIVVERGASARGSGPGASSTPVGPTRRMFALSISTSSSIPPAFTRL